MASILWITLLKILLAFIVWIGTKIIYNIYFHPLHSFPGPVLARATRLYSAYIRAAGLSERKSLQWHNQYGGIVRIAPDELSFNTGSAWDDIYGTKSRKSQRLQKDPHFYMGATAPNGEKNMGAVSDEDHSRIRSVLAHAFSDRALHAQESLIRAHVDRLVQRLQDLHGKPTDIVRWMHHHSYDVIAHLCFGQDLDALGSKDWFPPARVVFEGIREGVTLIEVLRFVPFKATVLDILVWAFGKARRENFNASVARAMLRLRLAETTSIDFISHILRAKESAKELTESELTANVALLIDAGSETTATMLSGCLFYLSLNRTTLAELTHKLREDFRTHDQLSLQNLAKMKFLTHVIQESLRIYPPLPATLPRLTPATGAMINGVLIPPKTRVGMNAFAAYHSAQNFAHADMFIPQRWDNTNDRFARDQRHVHQPFSLGSRGCLGKNLAWAEIRLTLACLLWNFEVILEPGQEEWHGKQLTWFIWNKDPLYMRFARRTK
ncbi:fusicoccadiene 8-ol C-15 hydroxylase [Corynespora cassiicola Philippines]|uniref:Fusicoccadiene 8-ol C-15 hydroxylase n=1 Tax=Corynespora cassiicola Philippines TaxID=1448308 RepID=A0A2T2N185_CORCC|nr:fusicoccadiene 8-ol C-15 hydroxylase [Corynespora cassiicola Philippines]